MERKIVLGKFQKQMHSKPTIEIFLKHNRGPWEGRSKTLMMQKKLKTINKNISNAMICANKNGKKKFKRKQEQGPEQPRLEMPFLKLKVS